MSESLAKLESKAIAVMRKAAAEPLPVDAAHCSNLADVVRDAYAAGERNMLECVLAAWNEYVGDAEHEGHDSLDQYLADLADLMKAAGLSE